MDVLHSEEPETLPDSQQEPYRDILCIPHQYTHPAHLLRHLLPHLPPELVIAQEQRPPARGVHQLHGARYQKTARVILCHDLQKFNQHLCTRTAREQH